VPGRIWFGSVFLGDQEREQLFADLDCKEVSVVWNVQDDPESYEAERQHFKAALWTPIEDFSAPDDRDAFLRDLDRVIALLRAGRNLYLHCAAGHGRTGLALASILVRLGISARAALHQTQQATGGPETAEQEEFVESLPAAPPP
jgi:protein-tyrosine phosphatase